MTATRRSSPLPRSIRRTAVLGLLVAVLAGSTAALAGPASAAVPSGPTGLAVTAQNGAVVTLGWTDTATDETGYELEGCALPACTTFTRLVRLAPNTVTFTDPALNGATRYRVRAVNADGPSAFSNTVDVGVGLGIESPTAAISAAPTEGTGPLAVAFDGSASVGFAGAAVTSWTWTFGDGATATGAVVSHTYAAPGTYLAVLEVRQGFGVDRAWVPVYVSPRVLTAPSGLVATAPARTRVVLGWTNPAATTTTQLVVQRCKGATCTAFTNVATLAPTATTYNDTTVSARTAYRYRLRATDGVGTVFSTVAAVTTPR